RAERGSRRAAGAHRLGAAAARALRTPVRAGEPRALRAARRRGGGRRRSAARRVRAAARRRPEREPLGWQPPAAQPRSGAHRPARGAPPRRAHRGARPDAAPPALGPRRRAPAGRRRRLLRDAEPRRASAARRPGGAPRRRRAELPGRASGRGDVRVKRVALLLAKDLRILRRSPVLLGALLTYPLVIAALVGLVAGYANTKPRVALVDLDHLPRTIVVGGRVFSVEDTIDEISQNVKLVRLGPDEAERELRHGRLVATLTVPPGFVADLKGQVI